MDAIETAPLPLALRPKQTRNKRKPWGPVTTELKLMGGRQKVFNILKLSDDEQAKAVVAEYVEHGHEISLEAVVEKAGLTHEDFIGLVARTCYRFRQLREKTLGSIHAVGMMKASIKRALDPKGFKDRELHFKASGYVPTPRGIQIGMKQVTSVEREEPETPGRPRSFERGSRTIIRELPPEAE